MQREKYAVVYEGDGEWSALYLDGKLERVGDHYLIDERIRELFGVQTVQSNNFLLGGDGRQSVARTLGEVHAYGIDRAERLAEAERLRDRAAALLKQAEELDE